MIVPKNPIIWQKAPKNLDLSPGEIHIWRVDLNCWESHVHFILNHLSQEELQRGRRFIQEKHRRRFYTAKAFLRHILAKYLQSEPLALQFREGNFGKPYLARICHHQAASLYFNLSHSENTALYALSADFEVGIDTEYLNHSLQVEPLIRRCCTVDEANWLINLPEQRRQEGFYDLWTRKEAYLKTLGWGLSRLEQAVTESSLEIPMISFEPAPAYTAALAWQNLNRFDIIPIHFFTMERF